MTLSAFRPSLMPETFRSELSTIQIKEFFTRDTSFSIESVSNDEIILDLQNIKKLTGTYLFDSSRFGCAMLQTLASIKKSPNDSRLTSWLQIQSYYSAYFSAHAIMRLTGTSCTNFERADFEKINRLAKAQSLIGPRDKIEHGYFKVELSEDNRVIMKRATDRSHVFIWQTFADVLKRAKLKSNIPSISNEEREMLEIAINGIMKLISQDEGLHTWLSVRRNEINYKIPQDVWHPFSNCNIDSEAANNLINFEIRDIFNQSSFTFSNDDTRSLAAHANINKLAYEAISDISKLIDYRKNSLSRFSYIYENIYKRAI